MSYLWLVVLFLGAMGGGHSHAHTHSHGGAACCEHGHGGGGGASLASRRANACTSATGQRFPRAVVWAPLPGLTWVAPFIGHVGVCGTDGVIRDFLGTGYVARDAFGFGRATRVLELGGDPEPAAAAHNHDVALTRALRFYGEGYGRNYSLLSSNCHEFVCHVLNLQAFQGKRDWNMVHLAVLLFFKGRFVDGKGAFWTWAPFLLFTVPAVYLTGATGLLAWVVVVGGLVSWLVFFSFVVHSPEVIIQRTPMLKADDVLLCSAEMSTVAQSAASSSEP